MIASVLVCSLIILGGCDKKDLSVLLKTCFSNDVPEIKSLNTGKKTNIADIEGEIKDSKAFGEEFFMTWLGQI